jgi:hypothetical protein
MDERKPYEIPCTVLGVVVMAIGAFFFHGWQTYVVIGLGAGIFGAGYGPAAVRRKKAKEQEGS